MKSFIHIRSLGNKKISSKQKNRKSALQQFSVDIARAKGTAIEDMLEYEITTVPCLFTEDKMMKKSTKSDLLRELEKHLPGDEAKLTLQDNKMRTAYIVDIMSTIRKLKTNEISNFGGYCRNALDFIEKSCPKVYGIDCIFDQYKELLIKEKNRDPSYPSFYNQ